MSFLYHLVFILRLEILQDTAMVSVSKDFSQI